MANKGGRPKKEIDWELVARMAHIHCTHEEVASLINVSVDTLHNRCPEANGCGFSEWFDQKKQGGKASLRRLQWKRAESGDKTMLIWLGKQWLNQGDRSFIDQTVKSDNRHVYFPSNGREVTDDGSEST